MPQPANKKHEILCVILLNLMVLMIVTNKGMLLPKCVDSQTFNNHVRLILQQPHHLKTNNCQAELVRVSHFSRGS